MTESARPPTSRHTEDALARTIYGLILTLATVGELIHHNESAGASVAWLLGAGAVLLAAHLFSDALAHLASTHNDPTWSATIRIARANVSVTLGFLGAALIMAIAGLADVDTQSALIACIAVGLVAVAALSFYATAHHRLLTRVVTGSAAAVLCAAIVLGENAF